MKRVLVICALACLPPTMARAQTPAADLPELPSVANALQERAPAGAAADPHPEFTKLFKDKQFDGAWDYALREAERKPDAPAGLILQSQVRLGEKRYPEALRLSQAAVERFPKSSEALRARASVHGHEEKFEAAIVDLTAAIGLDDTPTARNERGVYLSLLGRSVEALSDFERVPSERRNALCLTLMSRGLLAQGRKKEALEAVQQATKLAPNDPVPYVYLTTALIDNGDLRGALDALRQAVEVGPELVELRKVHAKVLATVGDNEAALAEHNEIVRLAKTDQERSAALQGRAALHVKRKAFHAAAADLSAALEADPRATDCYVERAECQREQRDFAAAQRDLTTAIDGVTQNKLPAGAVPLVDLYRRRATVNLFLGDDAAYARDRAEVARLDAGDAPAALAASTPPPPAVRVSPAAEPSRDRADQLEFSPGSPLAPQESELADTRVRVRQLGDLQRLQVQGGKTFPAEQVRVSLERNFDVLLAARPEAPLDELLSTVEGALRTSFRLAGFLEPRISARADAASETLVVEIAEGPRCLQGRVRIEGDHPLDIPRLEAFFLDPIPQAKLRDRKQAKDEQTLVQTAGGDDQALSPPPWKPGDPAPLEEHAWQQFEKRGEYACADQGYHYARVEARVVPDKATGKAELQVRIVDSGPQALLGDVQVEGAERHTADDLIRFLGLQLGQVITHDELADLGRRLRESGRFLEADVDLVLPPGERERVDLLFKVKESPWARHLSAPLSPSEAAVFRLRQWLADQRNWPGDLVIRSHNLPFEAELTLARDNRAVVRYDGAAPGLERTVTMLMLAPTRVGLFSGASRRALAIDVPDGYRRRFSLDVLFTATPAKEGKDDEFGWGFGLGVKGRSNPEKQPVVALSLDVPAYYCFAVLSGSRQADLNAGVWTMTGKNTQLRFEDSSGRLIELISYSDDREGGGRKEIVTARWETGALDRRLAEVERLAGGLANTVDPNRPLSGLVAFACDELAARGGAQLTPERVQALRRFRWAVDRGMLGLLDRYARLTSNSTEAEYLPPAPAQATPLGTNLWAMFLPPLLPEFEPLFAPATWPRTALVESVFVLSGHGEHISRALGRLYASPDTGPLACLAIAALASQRDPLVARSFARLGRARLTAEQFTADCQAALDRRGALGETLCRAFEVLRTLEPEEAQAVGAYLAPADQAAFAQFHAALRASPAPLEQVLPAAAQAAWNAGVRERIEALLTRLELSSASPTTVAAP